MKRFASLLCSTAIAVLALTAKPAHSQTAAFNPNDASFNFGTVGVGDSSLTGTLSFHRTNVIPLTNVTVASVTLSDTTNYTIQDECTGITLLSPADPTVPNRSYCNVAVFFHPTVPGPLPATITIASNATNGPHVFNLTGSGVEADISPAAPIIPDTPVGQLSAAAGVLVANNGTEDLNIGALSVVGEDFVNFTISNDNCSNGTVAPGSDCLFEVIFSPDEARSFSANILIPSNDPGAPNFLLAVIANGVAPTISATTPVVADTVVGSTSLSDTITVSNTSTDAPLEIGQIVLVGDDAVNFSLSNDNCSNSTVAPGSDCILEYTFSPDELRTFNASVSISSNDLTTPNLLVTLTGDGIAGPVMTVKPSSLLVEFPATGVGLDSAPQIVEIQNTGTTPLENVALTLPIAPYFSFLQDHCTGATLAPSESCLVQVVFTPDAPGLTIDELITISADTVASQVLTIRGEGIDGPALAILPASGDLNFPDTGVGQTSAPLIVQVQNVGTVLIENVTATSPSPVFPIVQDNCAGTDLAPGQSCLVQYAFAPDDVLNFDGTATILNDTIPGSIDIDLNGVGVGGPLLSLSSSALSFGDTLVGNVDVPQLVQVRNTGTADVSITSVSNTGPDFFLASDTCSGETLGAGESCFLQVIFGPTEAGNLSDTFTVASDADNQPTEFTVDGEGLPIPVIPGLGLLQIKTDVMSFNLEGGDSESQSTTVTNIGEGPVQITGLSLEGDSAFSQVNDCEGQTLAVGATCTITATFSSNSSGNFNAVVSIDSNPETSAFLVLVGSSLNDEIGGGGCSLAAGANVMSASWLWLAPIFAVGIFRRRIR